MELLIGAGSNHTRQMNIVGGPREWRDLVTLDFNADHKPDVLHDLTKFPYPFPDDHFDEIHAYEVLEHMGGPGDWKFFFDQWAEFYRILKHGGVFFGHSPHHASPWAWGDPGHTRVVTIESLIFLNQQAYTEQVGNTAMTDYRFYYRADFEINHSELREETIYFILTAIKPSRISI